MGILIGRGGSAMVLNITDPSFKETHPLKLLGRQQAEHLTEEV